MENPFCSFDYAAAWAPAVATDVALSLVDFCNFTNRGFPVLGGRFFQIFTSGIPCVFTTNSLDRGYKDHADQVYYLF